MPFNKLSYSKKFELQEKLLARHVRTLSRVSLLSAVICSPLAMSEETLRLEEVVVTASKRSESMQDVPISMTALGSEKLEQLNISGFEDYVMQMPSVSFIQRSPGLGQLFMRGISDGGNSNQSLQGSAVAIYLDEAPVTAIGRNLDVHIYDVDRLEVLVGPQGTLYGAASEAGNLRIITKKPEFDVFEAGFDVSGETISDGGQGYGVEGFANIPLTDTAALRVAAWKTKDGGYIDAVPGTLVFPDSGIVRTNEGYVKNDFNEAEKQGMRAALRVDLNDSWTATVTTMYQETDTTGIWDQDPEMDEFEVARFYNDDDNDEWTKLGLVLEGDLGFADLTYAGSYLDRDFEVYNDYSAYSVGSYVEPYYTCYVSYFGPCVDPSIQYQQETSMKFTTHELRLVSKQDQKTRWIVGAFYMQNKLDFNSQWHIPGINPGAAVVDDLYFQTDQVRKDSEVSVFGELSYDFTDDLTATVGYRWFDDETTLKGFVGTVWWPDCCYTFSDSPPPDNVDSKFSGSDSIVKLNVAYNLTEDLMIYANYSEGYRPGGVNRTDQVGATYEPDFLESRELGMKGTFMDGRWRLNGAVYQSDWDDFQIGFFNPEISKLGLVDNVGSATSEGIEFDTTFLVSENFELSAGYSHNKAELSADYSDGRGEGADAIDGQDLPFTPDTKYNLTGRFSFEVMGMEGHAQLNYVHTDAMWNDIFLAKREQMKAYSLLNGSIGVQSDKWTAELYAENLTNEVADLYINTADAVRLVTVNKPRTIGARFGMKFN
mgnify:CR=1 FL=1